MQAPRPEDVDGREVAVVALPAGPAVRVHAISESGAGSGRTTFVEGVDHFVPVPGADDALLLSCTTPSVAVGDLLLPLFDEIARSLRFPSSDDPAENEDEDGREVGGAAHQGRLRQAR